MQMPKRFLKFLLNWIVFHVSTPFVLLNFPHIRKQCSYSLIFSGRSLWRYTWLPLFLTFIINSPKLLTIHFNTSRTQILLNIPIAPTLFQRPRIVFATVYKFIFLLLLYFSNKVDLAGWTLLKPNHLMLFLSSKSSNSISAPSEWIPKHVSGYTRC